MEARKVRLIINSVGGNAGVKAKNYKISLPSKWVKAMGLSDNNTAEIIFDGNQIIIKRSVSTEEFIKNALEKGHNIKLLSYYNNNELCTKIFADFTSKTLKIENTDAENILLAFGSNNIPTWEDFQYFLSERCVPKTRDGIKSYIAELGLYEYDTLEIIKKTQGRMSEDKQWLEVIDL